METNPSIDKLLAIAEFIDADAARLRLASLVGQGVTDDDIEPLIPILIEAAHLSPDPDRALHSFSRWFAAVASPYSHLRALLADPTALERFCLVTGSSQYFADLLARQPEYFEILTSPGTRGGTRTAARYVRELDALMHACRLPELKRDALRRWKAREMLRIGVRDFLGLADMPTTAREFSNLADACVRAALEIARSMAPLVPETPEIPFSVIAMGKLGGQELNYSSDIDLMFVHGDAVVPEVRTFAGRRLETRIYLSRLAESIIKILAEDTANGHVFRVDMRLRPEGRFGALVRSLGAYKAYYESWAENWERQALLKARAIAGDAALGADFIATAHAYVYRRQVDQAFVRDIRDNKRRIEQKAQMEGEELTNVKTGFGGIRDVEFIVQLLQLQLGGGSAYLRTTNTLSAIQRLRHTHRLTHTEAVELADDYAFLRTLEHRLQLLHGFQTQTLPSPTDAAGRTGIARRMGYPDRDAFEKDMERRRSRVRGHLDRLFYSGEETPEPIAGANGWSGLPQLLDNMETSAARERLAAMLADAGILDTPAAMRALALPMRGNEFGEMPPDTPPAFKRIAPRLLDLISQSCDPDAALAGIEAIALAVPNRAQLYAAFDDSPDLMIRLVSLAAASPPLLTSLARRLEWMESLLSPDELDATWEPATELSVRMQGAGAPDEKLEAIARFYQRELLQIGARDIWGEDDLAATCARLTALVDAGLQAVLNAATETVARSSPAPESVQAVASTIAIGGLGKLGGAEPGYASDWDVLFVRDPGRSAETRDQITERNAIGSAIVETIVTQVRTFAQRGAKVEIDLRLRPWGRTGALIHTPDRFTDYYRTDAETWERQAALKIRHVAGNTAAGHRLVRLLRAAAFSAGLSSSQDAEVRAMKRRIETERLRPDQAEHDIKLGHGGLSDIEWLAQRLQMLHGAHAPSIRVSGTIAAVRSLAGARLLPGSDAELLAETYALLSRIRNAMWLQTGLPQDTLPSDARRAASLAHRLGFGSDGASHLRDHVHERMVQVRRVFQQQFYDAE